MKYAITLIALASVQHVASAQFVGSYVPNPSPLNYLPNYYNRWTQPLSPYLNLWRGGNPATNYYYGVRPGTPAGGVNIFGQPPVYQPFVGTGSSGFLPQAAQPSDGSPPFDLGGRPVALRSPSHPVIYGNTFGNHGSFASVYAQRGGQLYSGPQQRASMPPRK